MKTALITGISGQDGAYLAKLLLEKGYRVIGGERRTASGSLWRLQSLGIANDVEITDFELAEFTNIYTVIEKFQPDEIYNLAAQSFVAVSFEMPIMTSDITGLGVSRILEAIRKINPKIKFYQASTSEMFGRMVENPAKESTPFYPRSPYGVSKLYGHWITKNYRESYDMFACSGILFNHESERRGIEFVTRKITDGVARIYLGLQDKIMLGNLDAQRDWGYAPDYVEAMWLMLQQDKPDDYVIATGETHSIREFLEIAFDEVGIKNYMNHIKIDEKFMRPAEVEYLRGDATKAKEILGWGPKSSFENLVRKMVRNDVKSYLSYEQYKHPRFNLNG